MATFNLAGQGVQSLTPGTVHLQVTITVFGSGYSVGQANPANFFHLGLFRFGTSGFFRPAVPLDAQQMLLDVPPGADTLGYSLLTQTEVTVVEQ